MNGKAVGGAGRVWPALALALLSFSFAWVWRVGHRGLFVLDQSILFDGAWRLLQGQVPYRDFLMPFGPTAFVLQAGVFAVAGAEFSSMVLLAALLSVVATAAAGRIAWRLSGASPGLSLVAMALTAIWFQGPFGTPWMEQTAFFFNFLALLCVVERPSRPRASWALAVLGGCFSALAILSKQNAGGLFVGVCLGVLVLHDETRFAAARARLGAYCLGCALGLVGFALWLWVYSDPAAFAHYGLEVAGEVGWSRIAYWKLPGTLFFHELLSSSAPLLLLSSALGLAGLAMAWGARRSPPKLPPDRGALLRTSAWLAVSLPQFLSFFQLTTNNEASNNNAFVGLCVCSSAVLIRPLLSGRLTVLWTGLTRAGVHAPAEQQTEVPAGLLRGLTVAMVGFAGYSAAEGLIVGHGRFVQQFRGGEEYSEPLRTEGLEGLRWASPTHLTPEGCRVFSGACSVASQGAQVAVPQVLLARDLEALVQTLRSLDEPFFVFPDTTMLYGLTGQPSPQPMLYFHPGQSYSVGDLEQLDERIVRSLQAQQISSIVWERASFMGTENRAAGFPRLRRWIDETFEPKQAFGHYLLLAAKESALRTARQP